MYFCLVFLSDISFSFRCLVRRGPTIAMKTLYRKSRFLATLTGSGFLEMLDEQPPLRTATLTRPCASSETWKPHRLDSVEGM